MDNINWQMVLLFSIPENILMIYIASYLFGMKPKTKNLILISLLNGVASLFIRVLPIKFGINILLQLPILVISLMFGLKTTFRKALPISLIGIIIVGLVEGLSFAGTYYILGSYIQVMLQDPWKRVMLSVPVLIFLVGITLLIQRYKLSLGNIENTVSKFKKTPVSSTLIIMIFIETVIFLFLYLSFYVNQLDIFPTVNFKNALIVSSIFFLLFITAAFVMVKKLFTLAEKEMLLESQGVHIDYMNDLIKGLRMERHDFLGHLQAIYGSLETGYYEEAASYAANITNHFGSNYNILKIRQPVIAGFLKSKAELAESKHINFQIEAETTLQNLEKNLMDIIRILGNLIDNALEAVEDLSPEQRIVVLNMEEDEDIFLFEVVNNGPMIPSDIENKIFQAGFSTKRSNGSGGMGLTIVRDLVQRNHGNIHLVKNSPGEIVFRVYLPKDTPKIMR